MFDRVDIKVFLPKQQEEKHTHEIHMAIKLSAKILRQNEDENMLKRVSRN